MKGFTAAIGTHVRSMGSALVACVLLLQQAISGTEAMTLQTITGPIAYAGFGHSVANAGDVNGDGYPDFIVGNYSSGSGRAYIYFGGPAMDTIPDVVLINQLDNDHFGISVSGAGDVNGDGYDDVVVGADQSGPMGLDSGHVYIFFGGAVMDSIPDIIMAGAPGDLFGGSVAGAGDVNGDGYADVIVGAPANGAGGLNAGRAYIFFGGATLDNVPDVVLTGTYLENLGYSVSSAGDVNNDGFDDVVVGSPDYIQTSAIRGRAYVYFGGSPMDNVPDVVTATGDRAGTAVAGAGDLNGDGYSDVLVTDVRNGGRVLVYYGGSSMNNLPDVTLDGPGANSNFGFSIASAGDINGDGFADIIIGASGVNASTGKAYIYYGGVSMDSIPDLTFTGEAVSDRFGESVAGAGDVNGDGFSDVIVGARSAGVTGEGRAYLYLSSAGPLPIQLASFTATSIGQHHVRLDWTTRSEVNNYGFEIQRKRTGDPEFRRLPDPITPGHGTTIEPHSYSFTDSTASAGQWSYRLKQVDLDGSVHYSERVDVTVLSSAHENALAMEFALDQNYPNPFNPRTTIGYQLPSRCHVTLRLYDVVGREVATLVDDVEEPGYKTAQWNAAGIASGVYIYTLKAPTFDQSRKLVLLR